jgi:hypothetical protein
MVKSEERPEALFKPDVGAVYRSGLKGQKVACSTCHYLLAVHTEPPSFPAFDGPAHYGIFPTDFSSTMPSADCHWR